MHTAVFMFVVVVWRAWYYKKFIYLYCHST